MTEMLQNRYEFVLYFDVENGNPNGDPDAGNMPRIDPQTGLGIITDVCLKRKVRNFIELTQDASQGYDIYVSKGAVLINKQQEAYEFHGIKSKDDPNDKLTAQEYMCKRYFDIRAFGAVMDLKEYKCGQVCGPIQFCFAKSVDDISPQTISITRMASSGEKNEDTKLRTFGTKHIVPYGLYRVEGFISAKLAQKTGFSEQDLQLFWQALKLMFDHDRSAARGKMASRKLFIFKHDCELGNAPAATLFDLITAERLNKEMPPRAFADYEINVNRPALPDGVELIEEL